jgi:hypothetical protein
LGSGIVDDFTEVRVDIRIMGFKPEGFDVLGSRAVEVHLCGRCFCCGELFVIRLMPTIRCVGRSRQVRVSDKPLS